MAARGAAERIGETLPAGFLWAGVAGAGRKGVTERLEATLMEAGLARRVRVGTDSDAAFHAAFGYGDGVVVIAGTGSVALGRKATARDGGGAGTSFERVQVGGWGPTIDDAGSGCWFGKMALRAVARAADGRGPATSLSESVTKETGARGPAIVTWAESATRRDFATLAPVVIRDSNGGDAVAKQIVDEGVAALVELIIQAAKRSAPWSGSAPVALVGGLIQEGGPLRELLLDALAPVSSPAPPETANSPDAGRVSSPDAGGASLLGPAGSGPRINVVEGGDAAVGAARLALAGLRS